MAFRKMCPKSRQTRLHKMINMEAGEGEMHQRWTHFMMIEPQFFYLFCSIRRRMTSVTIPSGQICWAHCHSIDFLRLIPAPFIKDWQKALLQTCNAWIITDILIMKCLLANGCNIKAGQRALDYRSVAPRTYTNHCKFYKYFRTVRYVLPKKACQVLPCTALTI